MVGRKTGRQVEVDATMGYNSKHQLDFSTTTYEIFVHKLSISQAIFQKHSKTLFKLLIVLTRETFWMTFFAFRFKDAKRC
jgi:hypothetical protein